jgi:hypothetical protein
MPELIRMLLTLAESLEIPSSATLLSTQIATLLTQAVIEMTIQRSPQEPKQLYLAAYLAY